MRTSVMLVLTFLVFALSASLGPGAKAKDMPVRYNTESVSERFATPLCSDYLAIEPVQLTVPSSPRALRKQHERTQSSNWKTVNGHSALGFSFAPWSRHDSFISPLAPDGQAAARIHRADYLKFCILVI